MASVKIALAFALLAIAAVNSSPTPTIAAATSSTSDMPRPSYARTMLKVSRSLPGETEELKVRTSEGNVATLIVKRREKSVSSNLNAAAAATTKAPASTIGYQNVEVDPWNRVQTWSSVQDSNGNKITQQSVEPKSWIPLDSWKPLGEPISAESAAKRAASWLVADQADQARGFQTVAFDGNSNEPAIRYAYLSHEAPMRNLRTNIGANLHKNRDAKNVPPEIVIRSEINVKPQPASQQPAQPLPQQQQQQKKVEAKRLPLTVDLDGIPIVTGRRVPDEPIDKIQTWRNARVINDKLIMNEVPTIQTTTLVKGLERVGGDSFERFFEDVNKRYTKSPADEIVGNTRPQNYRNEVLAAEIYDTTEETFRPSIRKRMLQPDIGAIYPNSRVYSPPETSAPSVKPGTRAPVLQYAHPELGVQPAKIVKNNENTRRAPPMDDLDRQQQQYNGYQQQRSGHYQEQQQQQHNRQKKKYVLNDKNLVDSYNNKNYYPNHFYGLKRPMVEAPFWVKMTEGLKSHLSDGVNKVSELTKPVFDPLVEATRKISENLGLSGSRSQDPAQDKIGLATSTSSVVIPALGLFASGAALGIGAMAVGRYLDVNVLKRSNENGDHEIVDERALGVLRELERQGALGQQGVSATGGGEKDGMYLLVEDDRPAAAAAAAAASRRKRSAEKTDEDEDARRLQQRKGADKIAEIVEIDLPSRSLDDPTSDDGNDLQLDDEESLAKKIVEKALEAITSKATEMIEQEKKPVDSKPAARTRLRRSLYSVESDDELNDTLQNLENAEIAEAGHVPGDWTNTPCAKRLFCDAMVKRDSDANMFMEKKMSGLLRMIQPAAAVQVSAHFDEVMEAVRRHDCSIFSCPQARPAKVFF